MPSFPHPHNAITKAAILARLCNSSDSKSLVLRHEVLLETRHDTPHISLHVAIGVVVVQEIADALQLSRVQSE